MPVLSVETQVGSVGVLRHVACKFGVQYEGIVDQDGNTVVADLVGDTRRMIEVALRAGAKPVHIEAEIPHNERVRVYANRLEGK
jgi:hypothetical protein